MDRDRQEHLIMKNLTMREKKPKRTPQKTSGLLMEPEQFTEHKTTIVL